LAGILSWDLSKLTCLPILKSLPSVVAEILKGNSKFWGAPLAQGHAHYFARNFMMDFGSPKRLAKFEVAGFIYYGNIKELVFKNWDKPKWENS